MTETGLFILKFIVFIATVMVIDYIIKRIDAKYPQTKEFYMTLTTVYVAWPLATLLFIFIKLKYKLA
jgi:hypothetical protein